MASKTISVRRPSESKTARGSNLSAQSLKIHWAQLHRGDQEPFPNAARIEQQAGSAANLNEITAAHGGPAAVAAGLQRAWRAFHSGKFSDAIRFGSSLGPFGASAANKAAAVQSLYTRLPEDKIINLLNEAAGRGESAVRLLSEDANVHYTLALVLGRYSQRISILRALAQGMADRVRGHLERALELQPRHAEAHIALGLFHAEIIGKLGAVAGNLAYRASAQAAIQHFERALELTPDSPIALMEYAHGLLRMGAQPHRAKAVDLYRRAAACRPLDAMERLDRERAQHELAAL